MGALHIPPVELNPALTDQAVIARGATLAAAQQYRKGGGKAIKTCRLCGGPGHFEANCPLALEAPPAQLALKDAEPPSGLTKSQRRALNKRKAAAAAAAADANAWQPAKAQKPNGKGRGKGKGQHK